MTIINGRELKVKALNWGAWFVYAPGQEPTEGVAVYYYEYPDLWRCSACDLYWAPRDARSACQHIEAVRLTLPLPGQQPLPMGPQPPPDDYRIANCPANPDWHGVGAWFDEAARSQEVQ